MYYKGNKTYLEIAIEFSVDARCARNYLERYVKGLATYEHY